MRQSSNDPAWLWYSTKTSVFLPLDPQAYPDSRIVGYFKTRVPWPDWACMAPNGGIHIDARLGAIDVHVTEAPPPKLELTWSDPFGVKIIARRWLAAIEDLLEASDVFAGRVFREGQELASWATLHGRLSPEIRSTGFTKVCPNCDSLYTLPQRQHRFTDPRVLDRSVIVAGSGIYVRRNVALERDLRTPVGAFKPSLIRYRETPHLAPPEVIQPLPPPPGVFQQMAAKLGLVRLAEAFARTGPRA